MNKDISQQHKQTFEAIKNIDSNDNEFWYARALAKTLSYAEYRNFLPVIKKAEMACKASGQTIADHFVQVHEEISHGKKATRKYAEVDDK